MPLRINRRGFRCRCLSEERGRGHGGFAIFAQNQIYMVYRSVKRHWAERSSHFRNIFKTRIKCLIAQSNPFLFLIHDLLCIYDIFECINLSNCKISAGRELAADTDLTACSHNDPFISRCFFRFFHKYSIILMVLKLSHKDCWI